jgi:hypothetical protein
MHACMCVWRLFRGCSTIYLTWKGLLAQALVKERRPGKGVCSLPKTGTSARTPFHRKYYQCTVVNIKIVCTWFVSLHNVQYVRMYVCVHVHIYMHICIYTYTHRHKHVYKHSHGAHRHKHVYNHSHGDINMYTKHFHAEAVDQSGTILDLCI